MAHCTVLIVEDSRDIRDILARVLRRSGYEVIEASNGREALTSLQTKQADIVLLDLSMPILDGWAALEAIRALPGGEQLPVVAVTAHAMVGDREAVLAHGFDAYVTKPLDLRSLLDIVKQLLQHKQIAANGAHTL